MMPRTGKTRLSEADRGAIKEEMRALLRDLARTHQLITYSELANQIQTAYLHPHSFVFTRLLREVCGEEERAGHGMLCALVVSKTTGIPSGGYFTGLAGPDRDPDDLEALWREDLERLFAYWSEH